MVKVMEENKKMKEKTKFGDVKLKAAMGAIFCALVVFIVLVVVESHIVNAVDTTPVAVAIKDVPTGITLTQENIPSYFSLQERAKAELPVGTYSTASELVGKVVEKEVLCNQILTSSFLITEDLYADIEEPVEISLEVAKLGQAVGGTLRAGDRINLLLVVRNEEDEEDEEEITDVPSDVPPVVEVDVQEMDTSFLKSEDGSETDVIDTESNPVSDIVFGAVSNAVSSMLEDLLTDVSYGVTGDYACVAVAENVRITQVFNSSGQGTEEAEQSGTAQVATVVNVVIPKAKEKLICTALEEGVLRLSRVIEKNAVSEDIEDVTEEIPLLDESAAEETAADVEENAETVVEE